MTHLDEKALELTAPLSMSMFATQRHMMEQLIEDREALRVAISALPSSPVSELVDRFCEELREKAIDEIVVYPSDWIIAKKIRDIALTLSAKNAELEREVKRLREALTPFATEADELAVGVADDCVYALPRHPDLGLSDFDVGSLRAARRALSTSPQGADHG